MYRCNDRNKCTNSVNVYDQLRRELLLKELKPGTFIDVREKSEIYGTSTVPIREALLCLSESGLLVRERNRGFFVRHFHSDEVHFAYCALLHLSEYYLRRFSRDELPRMKSDPVAVIDDPYLFYQRVLGAATRIFGRHSVRHFTLNVDVVSSKWCITGGRFVVSDSKLSFLDSFARLAYADKLPAALNQLIQFSDFRQ